jgi:hypothetical protein
MAYYGLENFVRVLDYYGISDILLPFVLVFTLVYASLKKIKFLEDNKGVSLTVSLVMALTVVIMHVTHRYPADKDVVEIINIAIPNIMLVAVAVILFLLVVGLFKVEAGKLADVGYSWITLILLNVWVKNAFDEISSFFLVVSILLVAIVLVMGEGQKFFGRLPIIFGVTILMIFHNAVGWRNGLPNWLQFLSDSTFQTFTIGVLVFFFLISLVTREKVEKPKEKLFKLFG